MTELSLVIRNMEMVSLELSTLKKESDKKYHSIQVKYGMGGWIMFRSVHAAEYSNNVNGNMVTSAIAKEWKKLSKVQKLYWKEFAAISFP
jgi:hypothetical protein